MTQSTAAYIRQINSQGIAEVRTKAAAFPAVDQLLDTIKFVPIPALMPTFAAQAVAQMVPGYRLVEENGRWKGKPHTGLRNYLWGNTPEETLWKILIFAMERPEDMP